MNRTCPKCGEDDLSLLYHAEGETVGLYRKIKDEFYAKRVLNFDQEFIGVVANREFLSIHCRNCQYYWEELPLDAKEAGI